MHIDYDKVSQSYDTHRSGRGPYLPPLIEMARAARPIDVLELGAGTGAVTQAFCEAYPCRMVAVDRSRGMARRCAAKAPQTRTVVGMADAVPLPDRCVDFVFSVFMIHHLPRLDAFLAECRRVLRRGPVAIVTSTHAFLDRHPMNWYFPSFGAVDKQRFQPVEDVEAAMRDAGFDNVSARIVSSEPVPIDGTYVEKVANRFISTYALLPPAEFEAGLARLRQDVAANGRLAAPLVWQAAVIQGQRP